MWFGDGDPPPGNNYIAATTPIILFSGDQLIYRLDFPTITAATTYTYTYQPTTTANTTFYGGWWTQPQPGQPPLWAPHVGAVPTVPTAPPPGTPWLHPAPLAPPPSPPSQELDEVVKKQIEDAKLSPHIALVGYRGWLVDMDNEDGPMLRSLVSSVKWPYRQELCAHRLDAHNPGRWLNTPNGIHAARSAKHLVTLGYEQTARVTGEVYLWGRIIHGEIGYRAEKAYPKLIRSQRDHWWLKELAERYGIPYEITFPYESA